MAEYIIRGGMSTFVDILLYSLGKTIEYKVSVEKNYFNANKFTYIIKYIMNAIRSKIFNWNWKDNMN